MESLWCPVLRSAPARAGYTAVHDGTFSSSKTNSPIDPEVPGYGAL